MTKNHWVTILTLLVAAPLLMGQALAAQSQPTVAPLEIDGLAQGNDLLVSHAVSLRAAPAIAYNDDLDEYLVVWSDTRAGILAADIYGQILSSTGVPRGDNLGIRVEANNYLSFPDVAYDTSNGRYLVVWEDDDENDIEGQLLDQDGNAFGAAFNVMDGTSSDPCATPAVAFHPPTATYLVVYRRGTSGDYNIQGKRVDATGTVAATDYAVCTAAGDQTDPDVSANPANGGDFLIVWEDGRAAVDQIYGSLLFDTTWFLGAEFSISSHATEARTSPAVAFSPDAQEWLVVFERDAAGDAQIVGRRVTTAGATTGNNFGICGEIEDQADPAVAYDANSDQFLVAWEDERGGTPTDIYARRVGSGAGTVGNIFTVSASPGTQFGPALAASPAAPGYMVAFVDLNPTLVEDIVGQRVDITGTLAGYTFAISTPVNDQDQAAVAYNSTDDEYLVVWHDERTTVDDWDIWGQRLDVDGSLLGPGFCISAESDDQIRPDVTYNLDTNQYLVVWEDHRADADIYGQRVNADGSLDGAEIPIAGSGTTARRWPHVAFSPVSGEYLVVFVYETENNNIRGRRVPAASDPATAEFDIATGATDQNVPDVACRSQEPVGGGYLVVWRDTDGVQRDIKGRRLDPTGGLLGNVLDICTEASSQWSPAVAYSPDDDRYLVVWPDSRDNATQGRNIYGRQVSGSGTLFGEFGISTAIGNQAPVAVTYGSGSGSYVVAWEDDREAATAPDLYGQRVSGGGELLDTTAGANDLLFAFGGSQESPALAWAGAGTSGLVVWADGRNGLSYHIYGLLLQAQPVANDRIFLPLLLNE